MSNDYLDDVERMTPHSVARAAGVNAMFDAVRTAFERLPPLNALKEGRITYAQDTGVANVYAVAPDIAGAPSTYSAGLHLAFKAANSNTGPSSLNAWNLGACAIKHQGGADVRAGDIPAGGMIEVRHCGSHFVLLTVPAGLEAAAAAAAASASAAAGSAASADISATTASGSAASSANSASQAQAAVGGVKVSGNDMAASNLEAKLLGSGLVGLSTQNDGANETRTVDVPIASEADAIAGSSSTKAMTPERTKQATSYDVPFSAGWGADGAGEDIEVRPYYAVILSRDVTFTGERMRCEVAPTGAALIADIELNGASIYDTKPQIAAGATTGTAGELVDDAPVEALAGDLLEFKVTQIGSAIAGKKLSFGLVGHRR